MECGCRKDRITTLEGETIENNQTDNRLLNQEIRVRQEIIAKNNRIAEHNRKYLKSRDVFCLNWIGAPGSGKTSLLEYLIKHYREHLPIAVIEGDQQTDNDARRIKSLGATALQINTGSVCHLDAEMVHDALPKVDLEKNKLLIIENVGNMVCPTAYDLGENIKLSIVSCPEGENTLIKYPDLLLTSQILLINKIDLLPYLEYDLEDCIRMSQGVNPNLQVFPVSAKTGEGIPEFFTWLHQQSA